MGIKFSTRAIVGKNVYVIIFVQCQPGFEEDICDNLSDYLQRNNFQNNDYYLYYSFSEFDIIAIVRLSNESQLESLMTFSHSKIRDFQQVICYSFEQNDHALDPGPALTLTLFKFNEIEIGRQNFRIEKAANDLIKPIIKKVRGQSLLLGSLGWPEFIFIQSGKDLEVLLDSITEIAIDSDLKISHTLPCMQRKPSPELEVERKKLSFEQVEGDLENWRIAVSCHPQAGIKLKEELNKQYQSRDEKPLLDITATFGRRDLLVHPILGIEGGGLNTMKGLQSILSTIRSDFSDIVVSTRTDIGIPLKIKRRQTSPQSNKIAFSEETRTESLSIDFVGLQDDLRRFQEWEMQRNNLTLNQFSQLNQMVLRMQAIAATPGLESVVDDLFEFVRATVAKAASQIKRSPPIYVSDHNRSVYNDLEDMENVYFFGLEQRMAGARLGLGHPSQAYSNLQGLGIQHILKASKAIPLALLKSVNEDVADKWWGFTIFGFYNDTFTSGNGVINLPYQDMFRPEEWWRLGHESGHVFGLITSLEKNPILIESIKKLNGEILQNLFGREPLDLVNEMAVSVFEYIYCYRGDFDLYLKTTWRFFDHLLEGLENSERLKQYLLRAVFVYFFHLQVNDVIRPRELARDVLERGLRHETLFTGDTTRALRERAFGEENSIENLIRHSVIDPINQGTGRINYALRQVNLTDVAIGYNALEHIRSDLFDIFESYQEMGQEPKMDIKKYLEPDLRSILSIVGKSLDDGKIITGFSQNIDVFLIPLALQYWKNEMKRKNMSLRARIAAILSLCDMARRLQGEKVNPL